MERKYKKEIIIKKKNNYNKRYLLAATVFVILASMVLMPLASAHSNPGDTDVYVRTVSSDPANKQYTFTCEMDPSNNDLRDWFIRPEGENEEATILDLPADEDLTYTFQGDKFYHVGCVIVNSQNFSELWRGDLHIDLRQQDEDPRIEVVSASGLSITLEAVYSGNFNVQWNVIDAYTGESQTLSNDNPMTHHVLGHGLYDYVAVITDTDTNAVHEIGLPIEFFDQGDPYVPDQFGIPEGITSVWIRNSSNNTPSDDSTYEAVDPVPTVQLDHYENGSGWLLSLLTTDFTFFEPLDADMAPHVDGEGHAHWYLNGVKQGRIYESSYQIESLPVGYNNITVVLSTNDHKEYVSGGIPISDTIFIDVQDNQDNGDNTNSTDQNDTFGLNIISQDGLMVGLYCKPEGSSDDLIVDWNFGDGSYLYDTSNTQTHTYANTGDHYIQCDVWDNTKAEFTSLAGFYTIENIQTNNTGNNNTGNNDTGNNNTGGNDTQTNTTDGSENQTTAFYNLEGLPATCSVGSITDDTYNGGRDITCTDGNNLLRITAWDKPDSNNPSYFEMYQQTKQGSGIEICLGNTCIGDNGFARSQNYPIVLNTTGTGTSGNNDTTNNTTDGNSNQTNTTTGNNDTYGLNIISQDGLMVDLYCKPEGSSDDLIVDWNFGDGSYLYDTSNTQTHTYANTGDHYIQCDVWDNTKAEFTSLAGFYTIENIQTNNTGNNDTGNNNTGGNTGSGLAPEWISDLERDDVAPNYFHLELQIPDEFYLVDNSDWEIWTNGMGERVWSALNVYGEGRFHLHTPDGNFENSLSGSSRLEYDTPYTSRVRFKLTDGNTSEWVYRDFSTLAQQQSPPGAPQWTAAEGFTVETFATGLDYPTNIKMAPQDLYTHLPQEQRPHLYVNELYGKIKVVYEDGSSSVYAENLLNFDPFGSITGGGQMGVTGLYVDPDTGDLFAAMTYLDSSQSIKNKVVRFFTDSTGSSYTGTQIVIDDLPSSASHQVQDITVGPDGKLYVNLGDALTSSFAQDDSVFAGKIIRMDLDGSNVEVYAKGFRNPFGADWRPTYGTLYTTDNAPDSDDRIVRVIQGTNYGWGIDDNFQTWMDGALDYTNVSPVDLEFNPGNNVFPLNLKGMMYVAVAGPVYQSGPVDGKQIIEYGLDSQGNIVSKRDFIRYTGDGYGTPLGLEFGEDGLYFTDIYGEIGAIGYGSDGRILRVVPGIGGNNSVENSTFQNTISISLFYPKKIDDTGIQYEFTCNTYYGSGSYSYDWYFGDGGKLLNDGWNKKLHTYPYADQQYDVSCVSRDLVSGETSTASMTINPINYIEEVQ